MASTGSFQTSSYSNRYLVFAWTLKSQNSSTNKSVIAWSLRGAGGSTTAWLEAGNFQVKINNTIVYNSSTRIHLYNGTVVTTGEFTIAHNSDGTGSFTASAQAGIYTIAVNCSGSGSFTLNRIARQPVVSASSKALSETSLQVSWTSSLECNSVQYRIGSGSWNNVSGNGKSGSFTIGNRAAYGIYDIYVRCRASASGLWGESPKTSCRTYDWPHALTLPPFTLGQPVTIQLYNPLKRKVNVELRTTSGASGGSLSTNSTSVKGWNNTTLTTPFYNSIPDSKTGSYKCLVTYSGNMKTTTGGVFRIDESACKPVLGNLFYKDGSGTVNVTGDDQVLVQNFSNLLFKVNSWTYKNGAGFGSLKVECQGQEWSILENQQSEFVPLNYNNLSGANTYNVTLVDSRGVSTSKSILINWTEYFLPYAEISYSRVSNYYDETNILVKAKFCEIGSNNVAISGTCTTAGVSRPDLVNFYIADNVTKTITIDNDKEWNLQITLSDVFGGRTVYNYSIPRGLPIIFFDNIKNSVGVNCLPILENDFEVNNIALSRNVCSMFLNTTLTNLRAASTTVISLIEGLTIGDKLSVSDGGVLVGAGVSAVKISGFTQIDAKNTAGVRALRIVKNQLTNDANTLALNILRMDANDRAVLTFSPVIIQVSEGDLLSLAVYVSNASDQILGSSVGIRRTAFTVEVVS